MTLGQAVKCPTTWYFNNTHVDVAFCVLSLSSILFFDVLYGSHSLASKRFSFSFDSLRSD